MIILREVTFSDKKVSLRDRAIIALNKRLGTKKTREIDKAAFDGDYEPLRKSQKKVRKLRTGYNGIVTAAAAGLGAVAGASDRATRGARIKGALKYGVPVAALGAGLTAADHYLQKRADEKFIERFDKRIKKDPAKTEKRRDRVLVANGEMSMDDFAEKHGK